MAILFSSLFLISSGCLLHQLLKARLDAHRAQAPAHVTRRHEKTITIEEDAVGFGYTVRFSRLFARSQDSDGNRDNGRSACENTELISSDTELEHKQNEEKEKRQENIPTTTNSCDENFRRTSFMIGCSLPRQCE